MFSFMLLWCFHASLKPLNYTQPRIHSDLNIWSTDCLLASYSFFPPCIISTMKNSFWKLELNYRMYFSTIAWIKFPSHLMALCHVPDKFKKEKNIHSTLLINSKRRPYHTPQTLAFTNENNDEPSRMNYRSTETLRNHMSTLVWISVTI